MVDNSLDANDIADVNVNISDEQVDKFFESRGKELPSEEKVSETQEASNDAPSGDIPEKAADTTQSEKDETQREKYVRYEALHEERMKRKELAEKVKLAEEKSTRLEQTFQRMLQNAEQVANEQKVPSYEEDPLENLRQNQLRINQRLQQSDQYIQQQAQQTEQQQRMQQFVGRYQQDAMQYAKTQPDFMNAYNHLVTEKLNEYREAGYDDNTAIVLLQEDEAAVVAKAFTDGVNPGERLYKLATRRGYKPSATQGESKQTIDMKQAEEKIANIEKAMQENKTLNQVTGKSPLTGHEEITLEALSHMSEDELAEMVIGKNWNKVMKQMRR